MPSNTFYKCIALTKRCKLNNSRSHLPNYDYNERSAVCLSRILSRKWQAA